MLERGFISPSKSPVAATCFFMKKKDGTRRLVVDWRKLNVITKKDQYGLMCTEDIMENLRGATVFSKFDLRTGYNLVRIKKGDEWKMAFKM
jgi:hypothetical protein